MARGIVKGGNNDALGNFFGDGSDGAFNSAGSVTWNVTAHTGIAVKQFTSFILNSGHTLTVDNPCRGMIIYCQGDVTINGTISMTEKGGFGTHELPPLVVTKKNSGGSATVDKYLKLATSLEALRGGAGGNGGDSGGGAGGTGGQGRLLCGGYGGGGAGGNVGGSILYAECGAGGKTYAPTSYNTSSTQQPGICGSGAAGESSGSNATATGGNGGANRGGGGGGGGNTFADGSSCSGGDGADGNYAGGFICIIANGNVTIGSGGRLEARGGSGGAGGNASTTGLGVRRGGGGGGGAGGGVIAIFYTGSYSNSGSIDVSGGSGGAGGAGDGDGATSGGAGTSGGIGTIHVQKI